MLARESRVAPGSITPNIGKRKPMATYRIGCLAVRLFRPDVSGLMSMIG